MPIIIETPRLRIQTWEIDDIETLRQLTRDPGLSEFSVTGYADFSYEKARTWIDKQRDMFARRGFAKFAIWSKADECVIGISGLFEGNHRGVPSVDMNYRFPTRWRGQGFATEAARAILSFGFELGLDEIYANVDLRNAASQRVLKRIGMGQTDFVEYEGCQASRWVAKASGK